MPSFSCDHVSQGAVGVSIEELFPVCGVAEVSCRRPDLNTSEIGDDLPNLFVRHTYALSIGSVRRHRSPWNPLADISKQVGVRVSVTFMRLRKVGTAATAASAKSMA